MTPPKTKAAPAKTPARAKVSTKGKPDAERIAELERELGIASDAKPARRSPAKKAPARPSRAAAEKAAADTTDGPKLTTFRGIALTLPAQMPAAFSFDIAEVQFDLAEGNGLGGLHRLMVDFLGPDQWRTVRRKITEDGEAIDELGAIVTELMDAIVDPYGADAGK